MTRKPRRPEANATGPRPKPATTDQGRAVRLSAQAKEMVMAHAIAMAAEQGRLVSMREALDEIIFFWSEEKNAKKQHRNTNEATPGNP